MLEIRVQRDFCADAEGRDQTGSVARQVKAPALSRSDSGPPWLRYDGFDRQSKAREALRSVWPSAGSALGNLIWPPLSAMSGRPVSSPGLLDGADWASIHFIDEPLCDLCGVPFDYAQIGNPVCPACIARPPVWSKARSAFVYDEASKGLVLGFKHAGRTETVRSFGRWMARIGARLLDRDGLLIPVPLHPSRMRERRFNQSLLLARSVSKVTGVPVNASVLTRQRRTASQGTQTGKSRHRNVAGAFGVRACHSHEIADKHVVLIDDVLTTGATVSACARTLKRAGAGDVSVITLARVVKPVDLTK